MTGALDGILVVTLEQAVAAPFLSCRLADAGARVIKLERKDGDFARNYDDYVHGLSSYFVWLNRGKESLAIDIKDPADAALLHRLLAKADIWIQNLSVGATERAGFGSESLRERYPRLITVDISGYGEAGPPYDRMKAYDMLVQAESGICSVTGTPEEPARIGVSACDLGTGMFAHAAVLEALYERERTGRGKGVKASLFSSMADWMAAPLMHHEYAQKPWPRMALSHPVIVPYGAYATADGHLTLVACQNQREWERFCEHVLLQPELIQDPKLLRPVDRVNNRDYTNERIDAVLSTITREEMHKRLLKADVAFGSVNTVEDLAHHPALRRITVETPAGPVTHTAPAAYFAGETPQYRPVPALDQHGRAIREEFSE